MFVSLAVDNFTRFQRGFNGKQLGDPARTALLCIASAEDSLLHIILGNGAYRSAKINDMAKNEIAKAGKHLSISTDFPNE